MSRSRPAAIGAGVLVLGLTVWALAQVPTAPTNVTVNAQLGLPAILGLSVSSGPIGTAVTITGANFGQIQGVSTVRFNGTAATATAWAIGSITTSVPAGATTGSVVVTVAGNASNGSTFTVTPPAAAVVTITAPTNGTTYDAGTSATLTTLAGTATTGAFAPITSCTWTNSLGGSGTASGTTTWSVASIALTVGSNVITVSCANGSVTPGSDVLTVTRSSGGGGTNSCTGTTCWYVRANGATYGTGAGTSWTNAWSGFAGINWASVSAGHVILIAGGAYTQQLVLGKSGTAGNRVVLRRATATDAGATGAAGWSAGFDTTIVATTPSDGISFNGAGASWITLDGVTWQGWEISHPNNSQGIACDNTNSNITLQYLYVHGPPNPGSITRSSDTRGLDWTPVGTTTNLLLSHIDVKDEDSTAYISSTGSSTGVIVEYSWFHNADSANAAAFHQNLIFVGGINSMTVRYNRFFDIQTEGFFCGFSCNNVTLYGNDFYKGSVPQNTPRGIETDNGESPTNMLIYNNTFVDLSLAALRAGSGGLSGDFRNNLVINCPDPTFGSVTHSNNGYSGTGPSETGKTSGITVAFINEATFDYHIVGTVSSTKPRDKGATLAATYNTDADGDLRGADGTWDLGADEF